jgi:hypothetical protein
MSLILPTHSNHLPKDLESLNPSLANQWKEIQENKCFKNLFVPDGKMKGCYYQSLSEKSKVESVENFLRHPVLIKNHFSAIDEDLSKKIFKYNPFCVDGSELRKVQLFMSRLAKESVSFNEKVGKVVDPSNFKEDIKVAELLHGLLSEEGSFPFVDDESLSKYGQRLKSILGEPLYEKFAITMKRHHPKSPYYDCVANGFSPTRALERLNTERPYSEELTCPQ